MYLCFSMLNALLRKFWLYACVSVGNSMFIDSMHIDLTFLCRFCICFVFYFFKLSVNWRTVSGRAKSACSNCSGLTHTACSASATWSACDALHAPDAIVTKRLIRRHCMNLGHFGRVVASIIFLILILCPREFEPSRPRKTDVDLT